MPQTKLHFTDGEIFLSSEENQDIYYMNNKFFDAQLLIDFIIFHQNDKSLFFVDCSSNFHKVNSVCVLLDYLIATKCNLKFISECSTTEEIEYEFETKNTKIKVRIYQSQKFDLCSYSSIKEAIYPNSIPR